MNDDYICIFFASIHGLTLNEEVTSVKLEIHNLKIGNVEKLISDFYTPEVVQITGQNQLQNSLDWKSFLFSSFQLAKAEVHVNEKKVLSYFLKLSSILSNAFWLIKDNSVRFQTGHFRYTDNIIMTVNSNTVNGFFTNCIGERDSTEFSNDELITVISNFEFFYNLTKKDDDNKFEETHAEANRINRAYYFLDLARKTYDIGTKVSLYCSAFECLFSVSQTELKHRLSETIAHFLADDFTERKKIYEKIKLIYDLRSSVTHGAGISKKLLTNDGKKLKEIGINCDSILRACFNKIIETEEILNLYLENKNENISNYFTELILK